MKRILIILIAGLTCFNATGAPPEGICAKCLIERDYWDHQLKPEQIEGATKYLEELYKVKFDKCSPGKKVDILRSLAAAEDKVESCIAVLNPRLAKKIVNRMHKNLTIICDGFMQGGAQTQPGADWIKINTSDNLVSSSVEARLLHEYIHNVDSPLGLSTPFDVPGAPEAAYGCQYACFNVGGAAVSSLNSEFGGSEIPPISDSVFAKITNSQCTDQELCQARKQFATACRVGGLPNTPTLAKKALKSTFGVNCFYSNGRCASCKNFDLWKKLVKPEGFTPPRNISEDEITKAMTDIQLVEPVIKNKLDNPKYSSGNPKIDKMAEELISSGSSPCKQALLKNL